MIKNATDFLGLPLPNELNELEDDCPRIIESFKKLDANANNNDKALKVLVKSVEDLAAKDVEHEETLSGHAEELESLGSALENEVANRENALTGHDEDKTAHAALFKHLATGSLSPVIGICLAEEGGGAGNWCRVDKDGLPVNPPVSYFDYHPVYKSIRSVLVDGQIMQEHGKFYIRTGAIESGPLAGKYARWISPEPLEGFRLFSSFMKAGQEIDHWYCGAYQAIDTTPDAENAQKILGSRPGKQPFTNVDFPTMQTLCRARNKAGVTGFDMWDIYQAAEIQLLALLEAGTSDSQAFYGPGWVDGQWRKVNNVYQFDAKNVDDPTVASASWRGHIGLWGNVWQMVDGLRTRYSDKHIMIYKNDGTKTWVDTGIVAPERAKFGTAYAHAWPVNFRHQSGAGFDLSDIFYPETLSTGNQDPSAASIPDPYWGWQSDFGAGTDRVCYLGARWGDGSLAGLFACGLNDPASNASVYIGCRLART